MRATVNYAANLWERERRVWFAMRIIEHIEGYYETQDLEIGKVYKWHPDNITVECGECGKRSAYTRASLINSLITCGCGKDHTACIREELVIDLLEEDEALHPWRYWQSKATGIPFY